ncbi:MAG: hypothetical protein WBF33_30445 [Candidatus Nitrosopolaris sp.]
MGFQQLLDGRGSRQMGLLRQLTLAEPMEDDGAVTTKYMFGVPCRGMIPYFSKGNASF